MTSSDRKNILNNCSLFREFAEPTLDAIAPLLREITFSEDNVICMKGDPSDGLYIIREGRVEVSVASQDGKVIILGTLGADDVFGEIALLDQSTRTATVTALTEVTIYQLQQKDFEKVAADFGSQEWMAITGYVCSLFRSVTNSLEETMFLDTNMRVARTLLKLYERHGIGDKTESKIPISQEHLGQMVGLSREATNKALASLVEKGLVKPGYKAILIPDLTRLKTFAEGQDS